MINPPTQELKVSVVMATYNGGQFLGPQLDSILYQTRQANEILIVDDGSSDKTVALIRAYQQRHPQISLLINKTNKGSNRTFDIALTASTGDLIFISDQDDVWLPGKIEVMIQDWEIHKAGLTCSDACVIDSNGYLIAQSELDFHGQRKNLTTQESLFFTNTYSGHNMMLERQFLASAQPFPSGPVYDHWLAVVASGASQLRYLPTVLMQHRIHDCNQVNGKNKDRPRTSKKTRFKASRNSIYLLAKAVIGLPGEQPAKAIAQIILKHSTRSNTILSLSTFLVLLELRSYIFPNDKLSKQLRRIKNISLGPLGYYL